MTDKEKEVLPVGTEVEFNTLLKSIADTKLLLGYHFGEWTFRTPTLEAGIATCNFAQDELGHVRLLHGLLKNYSDEDDRTLIHERPVESYNAVKCVNSPISSWLDLISISAVVDTGMTILLRAMTNSSFRPLKERIGKILQEEKFHTDYTNAWFLSLVSDGELHAKKADDVISNSVSSYAEWFGSMSDNSLQKTEIMEKSNEEIIEETFESIDSLLTQSGINFPGAKEMASGNRNNYAEQPAEEIIYSLRGAKNEVFRV